MAKQYLLEVGLEEIPARFLLNLSQQLKERVENFLSEERIAFEAVNAYSTPRRLAVIVDGLSDRQSDLNERVKGPSLKVAKDDQGEWSKAAQGFARGQKASTDDLIIDGEYVYLDKHIEGLATKEVLTKMVDVISQMTFPVAMHWSNVATPYIRPIHWIVSLLENEIVPFTFVGVDASNVTKGHRFLGNDATIFHPNEYVKQLKEQFVLVDFEERQAIIRKQIETIAEEHNWNVPINEDLLEEVTSIVEWPTAFYGEFEEEYLDVPESVLITAMRDHQRYFYALAKDTEKLLPVFISVRNGNADHIENVIKGNRKVLKARLEDALFFYREDLSHELSYYLDKLTTVKEHVKIGSFSEKQARVEQGIKLVAKQLVPAQLETSDVVIAERAAQLYKFDLLTQTVGEFDELQGQMGQIYAEYYGESAEVAKAIGTQYLPVTSGGTLPDTKAGALLALVDKLDTLANYFNIKLIPTGSNDPHALRRKALGIVEIILDQAWDFDLLDILDAIVLQEESSEWSDLKEKLGNFIQARVQQHLEIDSIDHDIIQAVSNVEHLNVYYIVKSAHELQQFKQAQSSEYRAMVEAITRVVNLGAKVSEVEAIDLTILETESEKALVEKIEGLTSGSPKEVIQQLLDLVEVINAYFENNMVNADDEAIKRNRQATMKLLTSFVTEMVDPRELISKFD